jgi:DNA-binding NarL/FixJ family response regulator
MNAGHTPDDPRIRIVIAEDQELVRRGTALLLSMESDMEVVGQAADGIEATEVAMALKPDVILMDLHMPRKGGVSATRDITLALPRTQVLVLTTLNDDETVFAAIRAGAHGYLLKDASEAELLETIRALRRGESRLTPVIARKVMDQFRQLAISAEQSSPTHCPPGLPEPTRAPVTAGSGGVPNPLTEKEERILQLITDGMSNRQIGHAMNLVEGTIKNYVSRIMDKLHANTRTELAVITARKQRT